MATFADLTAKLHLNISNFATNLQKAHASMSKFAADLNGKINTGTKEATKNTRAWGLNIKSVSQVVSGILISQAFYRTINAIQDATSAVWNFSKELESAKIAYTSLFGDVSLANEFVNVLKDFAAVTPFAFGDAEKAAKRLLAYGIEYKNVMYVMQGVLAASSMTGDAQTVEAVSRALGQINTKGRLYNEEMRQLTEAGIPAYDILQEKLGLTNDQLKNLAKNAVPSNVAINALIDGINERFGGVLATTNMSMRGLFANLKDNLLMIGNVAIQPLFNKIKSLLVPLVDFVGMIRKVGETGGIGAIFEKLIPPQMQATVRAFIANLMNLWQVIKLNLANAFKTVLIVVEALMRVFNMLAPIVTAIIDVFGRLLQAILNNEKAVRFLTAAIAAAAAMWVIFKIKALAAAVVAVVIKGISFAVLGLSKALTFVIAHPFWALLIAVVGLVVGLSIGFDKLGNAVNGFFKKLTQFNGVDPDKLLLPSQKDREADLAKFNKRLSGTGDAMDDLADKTGKATKAAKGLLSFDEVFKLNQPDEGTDAGATDWGDFEMPDFGGIGEAILPEMPDFGSFAKDFVDNLLDSFGGPGGWGEQLLGAGIGALLGGALGFIIGGPIGAKIGMAIGAFVGWFWPEVARALGLTDVGTIALPIATVLGTAIGYLIGGPLGAVVGTGIGLLVGWIIDNIAKGLETGDWTGIGLPVGIGIGAGIGFLLGGPLGALIGGTIGALVGWIVDMFIDGFTNGNWKPQQLGGAIGGGIGTAIGMVAGGPVGALIGAAIGALVGWLIGLIVENWDSIAQWFKDFGANWMAGMTIIGDWFVDVGKAIGKFFSDIGKSIGDFFAGIGKWFADAWSGIKKFFGDMFKGIGQFFSDIWTSITTWFNDLFKKIGEFLGNIWTSISTWFSDLWNGIVEWATDIFSPLIDAFNNLFSFIGDVMNDIWEGITTVWNDIKDAVTTVVNQIWETLSEIFGFIKDLIVKVVSDIWNSVSEFFDKVWDKVSTWISDIWTKFTTWLGDIWTKVTTWFGEIWTAVSGFFADIWEAVTGFFSDIWNKFTTWLGDIWTKFTTWIGEVWTKFTTWLSDIWNKITTWFGDIFKKIGEFLGNIWNKITGWFSDVFKKIGEFFGNIWDKVTKFFSDIFKKVGEFFSDIIKKVVGFVSDVINKFTNFFSDLWSNIKTGVSNIYNTFKNWIKDIWDNVFGKFFGWISDGIGKLREFFGLDNKAKNTDTSYTDDSGGAPKAGHAIGGIFRREHVARFAEGNKAEMVVPLENASAMEPFVNAISNGIIQGLMPTFAAIAANNGSGGNTDAEALRPLYVGTLIADERGLKELERKMQVIRISENQRRG